MDENDFENLSGFIELSGRDKSAFMLSVQTAKTKAELFDILERFPEVVEKPDLDLPDEEPPSP
ncbi:hypothetical protein IAG44_25715 [Streptomyces roseirectus]|uniref:Uncharacterized protein n=1 Tax=Streptomyces roseirectus TaxID=2768066 RepID=A0A7H0II68_9ACTN|nr:hypothetical protein [Streptomyces roseirectus]QNP72484.1 hypothetical protein IAG44_25715 [Streptomyces roseirectus]